MGCDTDFALYHFLFISPLHASNTADAALSTWLTVIYLWFVCTELDWYLCILMAPILINMKPKPSHRHVGGFILHATFCHTCINLNNNKYIPHKFASCCRYNERNKWTESLFCKVPKISSVRLPSVQHSLVNAKTNCVSIYLVLFACHKPNIKFLQYHNVVTCLLANHVTKRPRKTNMFVLRK